MPFSPFQFTLHKIFQIIYWAYNIISNGTAMDPMKKKYAKLLSKSGSYVTYIGRLGMPKVQSFQFCGSQANGFVQRSMACQEFSFTYNHLLRDIITL